MATFEVQVEGLTGLSIDGSSSPTQDELSQFLKDGVLEVTSRIIRLNPAAQVEFARESAEQTSNGFNPGSTQILSVIRENGTDGQWYPCLLKPIQLQYKVTDKDSLYYASAFNPVYMITQNRNVHVYPEPTAGGNDGFKVLYVNFDPEESDGTDLQYDSTGIKWFPDDKVYLVILYSGIKALENALSNKSSELPDEIIFSAPELETINAMSLPEPPVAPELSGNSVSFSETAPTFDEPIVAPDFADANNWINTEEDEEMLRARVQLINAELQQYQSDIQNSVQKMNTENVEYQAKLQTAIQDAQLSSQDDAQKLTKYSGDLNKYQAEVSKEVQRWTSEEYNKKFNKWQQEYQGKLQEYANNIQNYNTKVSKVSADYKWMETRMLKLQQQYDTAFMVMQPKQKGEK